MLADHFELTLWMPLFSTSLGSFLLLLIYSLVSNAFGCFLVFQGCCFFDLTLDGMIYSLRVLLLRGVCCWFCACIAPRCFKVLLFGECSDV